MHTELVESIARFTSEMAKVDEAANVLLKGHLLLEEALSAIIDQYIFHRGHLMNARLSFAQKAHLARSFCLRKDQFGEWDLVFAINALRNDLAHRLESPDRGKRLAKVKEIYFREAANYEHIDQVKTKSDAQVLLHACGHCSGFLATFLADSRAFRQIVHTIDRNTNPDLPPFEQ